ncbi:MAG TPA: glycoside hydrolase family 36 protein [Bryobacteraceae bacterium]|nr:glycoside hydrolase family 36 protein [Bryobacteraceae bacterium]
MRLPKTFAFVLLSTPLSFSAEPSGEIDGKNFRIEFDKSMHSRVVAKFAGNEIPIGDFAPSEFLIVNGKPVLDFAFGEAMYEAMGIRRARLSGTAPSLKKTIFVDWSEFDPRIAIFQVEYTNTGPRDLHISSWTNNAYSISGKAFWSYQSGSYEKRPDWVVPLKPGFHQDNFMGMNASDYGGGTPVSDVWRRDVGIAVGHLEMSPKLVSVPVAMPDAEHATLAVTYKKDQVLKPGETLKTFRTFVVVHQGDYFQALVDYSHAMQQNGVKFNPAPESAFQPIWCAWGFERHFKVSQIINALPTVKRVGFNWVGVDYGWETVDGDWALAPDKFPHGDADMKSLVDKIHAEGFRAQLWWLPLGTRPEAELARKHPEFLLLNANGSKEKISFFDDYYLCPAVPEVVEYYRKLVVKIIRDWGYDGLKLDGMHMNGAPPCYNPAHHHTRPEDSVEAMPLFFKMIYDTARSIKPDVLVEWCPCGTAANFFTLPYINMSVASDPESSFQVRSKAKTLKALHGDATAYFGDHVELSTGHDDFASTIGVGGVVGSEFTWPPNSAGRNRDDLTPAKEQIWTKWVAIYKDKMLSRGEYLGGLYDIGFDRPEAHAIRKPGAMYYAFYAPDWTGKVELRGLDNRAYRVTDYENGKDLGTVRGPTALLDISFHKHLLLEAKPASE